MFNKPLQFTAAVALGAVLLSTGCAQESAQSQSAAEQTSVESTTSAAKAPETVTAKTVDAKTMELVEATASYLTAQPALSMGWFISYDTQSETNKASRVTHTWNGESTLVRGKGYHIVCEHGDTVEEFRHDGQTFTAINPGKNFYATTPINSASMVTLVETLQDKHSITLPAWELFSEDVAETLLADVDRAEYIGMTSILGQPAHHLAFSEPGQDWELWISTDAENPMPLMMAGHDPDVAYSGYQAMFHDWTTQPSEMQASFSFDPPEGLRKIEFSAINDQK